MQNSHLLLNKLDKAIFHENLEVFFSMYPYIHTNNTMLIDDTPYKSMLNGSHNSIFLEFFNDLNEEDNYLLGDCSLIFRILSFFQICCLHICANTINLVALDVLIEMILDNLKFYLWNAIVTVSPHFVIVRNWHWNKKHFFNCWFWSTCFNIWNISFQIY
jgi:hypothetical protein